MRAALHTRLVVRVTRTTTPRAMPAATASAHTAAAPADPPPASSSFPSLPPPVWPRPLRGSLSDARGIAPVRLPAADVASNPSRFPYADTFTVDGAPVPVADVRALLLPFVGEERVARFERVARSGRRFDVLPILEGVQDRGNVGAIARTADALGVGAMLAANVGGGHVHGTRGRCSAGSEKWIDIQLHACTVDAVAAAHAAGFRVVVAAAGPTSVPVADFDWETAPTAFIVGNEADGVSEEARAAADGEVAVPMAGFAESLNVSVASALIMQAALARLNAAGVRGALSEREAATLAAVLMGRHKASGRTAWREPMVRELLERACGGAAIPPPMTKG